MGRKPNLEKRAAIANQAVAVLRERGIRRTNMSELAQALGMKRTTLYWYFRDIGELFDVAFDQSNRRFYDVVARSMAGADHPIDLLEALMSGIVEHFEGSCDEVVMLAQLWAVGRSEELERVIEDGKGGLILFRTHLVALVRQGQAKGQIGECDPEGLVDVLLAQIHGTLVQMVVRDADPKPMLEIVRERLLEPLRVES